MKSYLVTTGVIFSLMSLIHVWRLIVERHHGDGGLFVLEMAVTIALPAALAVWAWRLLWKLLRAQSVSGSGKS